MPPSLGLPCFSYLNYVFYYVFFFIFVKCLSSLAYSVIYIAKGEIFSSENVCNEKEHACVYIITLSSIRGQNKFWNQNPDETS